MTPSNYLFKIYEMAKQIIDFKKLASEICQNRSEHEQKIRELYVNTEICSIDEFYKTYQQEVRDINAEITPSKDRLTDLTDFKDIFSAFEKYPSNLHKPKRVIAHKELNRTLAMPRTLSVSEVNGGCQSTSPHKILWEQGPPASEIYSGFRLFKQSLNNLLQEIKQTDSEADYIMKLQKLNIFAKDIEKLCGIECQDIKQAFTDEEANNLSCLVVNLEKALYIDANRDLFRKADHFNQSVQNLDNLLESLTYWLNSVGNYQEM